MSYLGTFASEFSKAIVLFEISTVEFVKLQNFGRKQKCLNLGPKMLYLGIFLTAPYDFENCALKPIQISFPKLL